MADYELIEHTADICVRVKGKDLRDLFKNAGLALFQISTEKISARYRKQYKLSIASRADNLDELFINWLNELLSLSSAKGLIFDDFKIDKISRNDIKAVALGGDIRNYKVNTEVKAATYHDLRIEESRDGWQAEVIFDV